MSLKVVPVGVAISAKVLQPVPWQRSMRYRRMPALSVAAVQERLIWVGPTAVAVRLAGAVGG